MLDIKKLKKGDRISEQQYYEVLNVSGNSVEVKNDEGNVITIGKDIVKRDCYDAGQFTNEVEMTRTDLINQFLNIGGEVFTVNYNKKVNKTNTVKNVDEFIKELLLAPNTKEINKLKKELKAQLKQDIDGEERTATGYKTSVDFEKGRTVAIDMMKDRGKGSYDNRIIQIDHRGLNWFIHKGVKYKLK
jgi:hypothetical protein